MLRIESMTLGALRRAGIDDARAWLLIRDSIKGRRRSKQALETVLRDELRVVLPDERNDLRKRYSDLEPFRHIALHHATTAHLERGVIESRITVAQGVWWDRGTLHCHLPDILRSAVIGRQLGDVIAMPGSRADAITKPPRQAGGLLSIDQEAVILRKPSLSRRAWHPFTRLSLLVEEAEMARLDTPMPAQMANSLILLAVLIVGYTLSVSRDIHGFSGAIANGGLILASILSVVNAVNGKLKRPYTPFSSAMVVPRHRAMLEQAKAERKN